MDTIARAKQIIDIVGSDNITYVTHCATRLRLSVADEARVDIARLDRVPGVLKSQFQAGQLQIIVGAAAASLFEAVSLHLAQTDATPQTQAVQIKKDVASRLVETISGIFGPVIPVLIGCGMVKSILAILVATKLISDKSGTYLVLALMSDLIFYFFPFFLAVSAAKKFKTNEYLAIALAGALMYPTILDGAAAVAKGGAPGTDVLGIPLLFVSYSTTIIPIILAVWALSHVYRWLNELIPDTFKVLVVPVLMLLIMVPLTLLVLGPLGHYIGFSVATVVSYLYSVSGIVGAFIFGTLRPVLIIFGMHYSITPINAQLIAHYGYSVIAPANLTGNLAQAAACLAVFFRMRNRANKVNSATASVTAMFGITEPAIFGFNLKYKWPFIVAMVSGGVGAAYINLRGGGATALVLPGVLALPTYIARDGFVHIIIGVLISVALAFVGTLFVRLREDEPPEPTEEGATPRVVRGTHHSNGTASVFTGTATLNAPVSGAVLDLTQVPDPIFASMILGAGVAIQPNLGEVHAPADATVVVLPPSRHAVGLRTDDGVDLLIHVGLETVALNGQHFTTHIAVGDRVKSGDLLLEFDLTAIKAAGYNLITPFVVTNSGDYASVAAVASGQVAASQPILEVTAKKPITT